MSNATGHFQALASLVEHLADSTRWRIYPLGDVVIKVVNKVLSVNNAN